MVKSYLLRLISSEPTLVFEIKKYVRDLKEEELVRFLAVRTVLRGRRESVELVDVAFAAIDRLLTCP